MRVQCKMVAGCEDLVPTRAHADDAGLDLRAAEDVVIPPAEVISDVCEGVAVELISFDRAKVRTGCCLAIPYGYEGQVRPRSGRSSLGEVVVLGTVDAGYRGEVSVIVENRTGSALTIKRGDKIAQLVIAPVWMGALEVVETLDSTDRGDNGFGSTGV